MKAISQISTRVEMTPADAASAFRKERNLR